MAEPYDFTFRAADGSEHSLAEHRGCAVLIVNTASKCGFTPQYEGLEALWRQYRDAGLAVLAFPCNQFGRQEPGTDAQIADFCRTSYDVTFPVMAKIEVNGSGATPLYQWLKRQKPGLLGTGAIKWNFTKFLLDRSGRVVARVAPSARPAALAQSIESALAASP